MEYERPECLFSAIEGGDGNHSWKESSRYPGDSHCRYCGNYKRGEQHFLHCLSLLSKKDWIDKIKWSGPDSASTQKAADPKDDGPDA